MNNDHDGEHSIIDINNKKELEDNNISYKKTISEFDEIYNSAKKLKIKIEEEMNKINNSQKNIEEEIISYFKNKHEELNQEEKKLKSDLVNKVTEIKEELKNFLIKSNDIISSCEKTNKAMEYYEKSNNNNDIKTLNYISEINKSKEKTKEFLNNKIRNIDISFNSENLLDFKDYYFNGIPIPKNIKVKQSGKKLFISWECETVINNIFEKMKYNIQIKNDKNISTYTSFETNLMLDKYENNFEYEIKVMAITGIYKSDWSEVKIFKAEEQNENKEIGDNINVFEENNNFGNNKNIFRLINTNKNPFLKNKETFNNKEIENDINNDTNENLISFGNPFLSPKTSKDKKVDEEKTNENPFAKYLKNNVNIQFNPFATYKFKDPLFKDEKQ